WETGTTREVTRFAGHQAAVICVAFHRDGQQLVSGSHDGMLMAWRLGDAGSTRAWRGHAQRVTGLTFSPDCSHLASCSTDESVKIWNFANVQQTPVVPPFPNEGFVFGIAFTHDGKNLARCAAFGPVRICETTRGQEVSKLSGRGANFLAIAFSANGKHAVAAGDDGSVSIWTIGGSAPVSTVPNGSVFTAFSPAGRTPASSRAVSVVLVDLASGREVGRLQGHKPLVGNIIFSPDGRRVAACGTDESTVNIWERSTGQIARSVRESPDRVMCFAFTP